MDRKFLRGWIGGALVLFGIVCLCSAIFPAWAHKNNRTLLPIKHEPTRRLLLSIIGVIFILAGSLLLYATFA